jgi:5-methylcytosine-specific restriction endonuclease McrA
MRLKIVKLCGNHFGLWKMSYHSGYFKWAFDIGYYRILWVANKKLYNKNNQTLLSRENLYNKFKGKCSYCGEKIPFNLFIVSHIIPKSKGGKTNWDNVVCSCVECAVKKVKHLLTEDN